ncbi:MAG: hypothetical protein V4559_12120 [Pseudomonadota bacterium]
MTVPIPANECGDCFACCQALPITQPELQKKAGILCLHHNGGRHGCTIYETRPTVCRGFLCGWRLVPELGDSWRPDRSGILPVLVEKTDAPENYRKGGDGFNFIIIGGEPAVSRPAFADYVRTLVSRGVAVYLSAETPKTLINPYLEKLAAIRDMPGMSAMLLHIYRLHLEQKRLMRQAEQAAQGATGP